MASVLAVVGGGRSDKLSIKLTNNHLLLPVLLLCFPLLLAVFCC